MQHFYDGQIRRYITQIVRMMSNFSYKDGKGNLTQVPVMYGDLTRQVANISPLKGIDVLLESFIRLSSKYPLIRLFIIGQKKSQFGKKIEKMAQDSPCGSKIHFTGKIENVKQYYSLGDIFVLPTSRKGEGCPVSLLDR